MGRRQLGWRHLHPFNAADVTGCTLSNNSAAYGGGIYNYAGTLTVTGSTFSNNSASFDGGGIYNYFGILYVGTSKFNGNNPDAIGGGYIDLGGNTFHLGVRAGDGEGGPPRRATQLQVADRVREPVAPEPVVRRVRVYAG